jgi:microcompartment protein CcmK/EutM
MFVAKAIGTVVSTCKEPNLTAQKLLIVQDLNGLGTKKSMIAVDAVGAGVGETVLVVLEGEAARQSIGSEEAPVNASVLGIVDPVGDYHCSQHVHRPTELG